MTYDANGNRTLHSDQDWDNETKTWVIDREIIKRFDANGNEILVEYISNNNPNSSYRVTSTYDENNNQVYSIRKSWDTVSKSWLNNNQHFSTYNEANILTNVYNQLWDSENGTWLNSYNTDFFEPIANLPQGNLR